VPVDGLSAMKVQLLPSSINDDGTASQGQRLTCFVVDDSVAFDAGSLAFACTNLQRQQIRDAVISHTHLDHIAGLPIFIDDLFATLTEPFRIHCTTEMFEVLESNVFNWDIYPRFSELTNVYGNVLEYSLVEPQNAFKVKHLEVVPVTVNHNSPSLGFLVSDGKVSVGITGDTSETSEIWNVFSECENLAAVFVECAFPDEMGKLASDSHHLTPARLASELAKLRDRKYPVYVSNIKAMYREVVVRQLDDLKLSDLNILEVGKSYAI